VEAPLANDLVDAMSIFTVPVVLGGGKKLFAAGAFKSRPRAVYRCRCLTRHRHPAAYLKNPSL
jgi:riboflavin biosynthesis pyrimidine reductase